MNRLPEHLQGLSGEDLKEALHHERHVQTIKLIMRQTDYTYEESELKLKEANNNYMLVMEQFMGIEKKEKTDDNNTVNQKIYGEIRHLMDTGAQQYRAVKERQEYMDMYRQRAMAVHMAREKAKKEKAEKAEKEEKEKLGCIEEENNDEDNKIIEN